LSGGGQALREQAPVVDRERQLSPAPGRHRGALDADDVADVEVDQERVGLRPEHVLARVQLDLAAAVADVDEGVLAVAAARRDPPRHPVARGRFLTRLQPLVLTSDRDDLLAVGELVGKRLDPGVPDPPELVAAVLKNVGELRLLRGLGTHRREPGGRITAARSW
jgi:hypothetical protein